MFMMLVAVLMILFGFSLIIYAAARSIARRYRGMHWNKSK